MDVSHQCVCGDQKELSVGINMLFKLGNLDGLVATYSCANV